jgi:hypothetical protein
MPHATLPDGQPAPATQSPATQTWPVPQARSQPPQWFASEVTSTQALLQAVCPVRQAAAHTPLVHSGLGAAQALAQVPQWAGSVSTLTVACPHCANPGVSVFPPQEATRSSNAIAIVCCMLSSPRRNLRVVQQGPCDG